LYHLVSIDEIEDRIAELHREGKTTRQIARDVRKNLTYVGAVLRKRFPEEYSKDNATSKETEALKMFSEGKRTTEVAIKMGWDFDQTEKVYLDYLKLQRLFKFCRIYQEEKQSLGLFLRFYRELKKRKIRTWKPFEDVLKVLDNNKAFGEEIDYFGRNVLPRILNE
jgi:hypothetical protein